MTDEEEAEDKRVGRLDRRGISHVEMEMIRLGDRLDNHERICTDRYNNIEKAIGFGIKILSGGGASLIIGMATILGYMIFHVK